MRIPRNLTEFRGFAALQFFLLAQAKALTDFGITPRSLAILTSHAFARAAAETSRLQNGRLNYSRIAARTGLKRAVVRQLLSAEGLAKTRMSWAPTDAVLQAWCTDRRFCDASGAPKRLNIGGKNSFKMLTGEYARDLPYRAILEELKLLGAVNARNGTVSLVARALRERYTYRSLSVATRKIIAILNSKAFRRKRI